ncbi:MAG: NCS1 family nucleobase:cation symporter-1 [Acidobacteriota bacterium]
MSRSAAGLYELRTEPGDGRLYNRDLAPTRIGERTWRTYDVAALWVGLAVNIPTYMLAAGLIEGGMNWWQAILTITLGNLIVLVPMLLNAHAGTKFGIPFPVLARASFGVLGAHVPALLRSAVACGWFGIQTWIGGTAINALMTIILPAWGEFGAGPWICFAAFWLINICVIVRGPESIRFLEDWAAPFLIVSGLALLFWAMNRAGGLGPMLSRPSRFETAGEFFRFFVPSLTAMVGFWATLALNIPDLTRFARGQKEQMLGQAMGLPTTMALFSFIGVSVTSATLVIYGEAIWDPVQLLAKFQSPLLIGVALVALAVATLSTNVAANVVAPANGFANVWPEKMTFARGGVLTGVIGIVMMPWKLLEDYGTYIFGWLVGYSGFLGPIAGIFIVDYVLIRRLRLSLYDLYRRGGLYEYSRGFNWKAVAALVAGVLAALVGLVFPSLRALYDYAWFVGFGVAALIYYFAMSGAPQVDLAVVPLATDAGEAGK